MEKNNRLLNKKKVVFIDRDGVLNYNLESHVLDSSDLRLYETSFDAIKLLNDHNILNIVITNQAVVGRELISKSQLDDIHDSLIGSFLKNGARLGPIYTCIHRENERCKCRKPGIGLFDRAVQELSLNRFRGYMIGDYYTDIIAGHKYGLKTLLVRTGRGYDSINTKKCCPTWICEDLLEAVCQVIND
jgi:D-glycero-D-manno-heptose 1,7-bisphosphate phosphatase